MKTYTVVLESTEDGRVRRVKVAARDEYDAMAQAEIAHYGYMAVAIEV